MTEATETAVAELKPCPHCGDLARLIRDERIFEGQHYDAYPEQRHGFLVECAGSCHSMTCWWHTEAEAIAAWNRRTDTAVVGEETEQQIEDRLMREEAADNLRLIDWIADKIGLPKEEELSRDNFAAWLRRSPTGGREAGLEEAAQIAEAEFRERHHEQMTADRPTSAGKTGALCVAIGGAASSKAIAQAIRALLPSEQKARS